MLRLTGLHEVFGWFDNLFTELYQFNFLCDWTQKGAINGSNWANFLTI